MNVKVFSTPTCPFCVMAKDWLKERKVQFTDVNVAQDAAAAKYMIEKTQQRGVPVIEIDGQFVIGFDRAKLASLLKVKP
jgi:glutaredoxin-like YruB-family protein